MDDTPYQRPAVLDAILTDAERLGFTMSCEDRTGSLLATLAASKPGGHVLELGTGVGAGAAWLLSGMSQDARLTTVEVAPDTQAVARRHLGHDPRVQFVTADADEWLTDYDGPPFDLAYVDCRPGKFRRLDELVAHLTRGALYAVDDLLPQATWPCDHEPRVDSFLKLFPEQPNLLATPLAWASGLVIAARL
ncbi:O-methyltransferase [Streptomyces sp. NPDC059575]|uniref:O-methyltransferase n=1 Tax=Streptomyces sp. NPDC059575 TaxID=3346872 RepID=UPI0036C80846